MRRKPQNSSDSLELLLDAICNTFGAVLFISMLVAILVSQSSTSEPSESAADSSLQMARAQLAVQEARATIRVLQQKLVQQQELTQRFANSASIQAASDVAQITRQRAQLIEDRSLAVEQSTDDRTQLVNLQHQLNNQAATLQQARQQHAQLTADIKREKKLKGRTARIPKIRRTTKAARVFAIDDGRLYRVTTRTGFDENDCRKTTNANQQIEISPIPGRGERISLTGNQSRISTKLKDLESDRHFVKLFVSRDSFAEFLPIKDALVKAGLEYETIITENEEVKLVIGDTTRESLVQ